MKRNEQEINIAGAPAKLEGAPLPKFRMKIVLHGGPNEAAIPLVRRQIDPFVVSVQDDIRNSVLPRS